LQKLLGSLDSRLLPRLLTRLLPRLLRLGWIFPLRLIGLLVGGFAGIGDHILGCIVIIRSFPSVDGLGRGLGTAGEPSLLDGGYIHGGLRDEHDSIEPGGIVFGSDQNIIEMGSIQQRGHNISGWAWTKPAYHSLGGVSRNVDRCSRLVVHGPQDIA